jgi:hypothetical protein
MRGILCLNCRYLVVASSIGAFMEAIAIFLTICKKKDGTPAKVLLPLLDAAVPVLLYSATAAAFAAGDMSYCAVGKRGGGCGSDSDSDKSTPCHHGCHSKH